MAEWTVGAEDSGSSLITFVKSMLGGKYSAREIKKAIEQNSCKVNGLTQRFASTQLGMGDKVVFYEPKPHFKSPHLTKISGLLLFADEDLLVINKPSGIPSDDETLKKALEQSMGRVALAHRLDKDTSGVLLFARNKQCYESLYNQFKTKKIEKRYFAIVDGVPKQSKGVIENYLGKLAEYQGQSIWGAVQKDKGLHAKTDWVKIEAGKNAALLECLPYTGRTHQIRVHLSSIGHPILGDGQYGRRFACEYQAPRILLHAYSLEIAHPGKKETIKFIAPFPQDFTEALQDLIKGKA